MSLPPAYHAQGGPCTQAPPPHFWIITSMSRLKTENSKLLFHLFSYIGKFIFIFSPEKKKYFISRVRRAGKPCIEATVAVTGHHLIISSSDTKDSTDRSVFIFNRLVGQVFYLQQTGRFLFKIFIQVGFYLKHLYRSVVSYSIDMSIFIFNIEVRFYS